MSTKNLADKQGMAILDALQEAERLGIKLAVWKNRNKIEESLGGGFNIDILVLEEYKEEFEDVMSEFNFFEADLIRKRIPNVTHYFSFTRGKPLHVHVYYRMITGESSLKEFDLPLVDYVLKNATRDPVFGLHVVNDEASCYLFLLRHYLKSGSIMGRRGYKGKAVREKEDFGVSDDLLKAVSFSSDPLKILSFLKPSDYLDGALPERSASIRIRWHLRKFLRKSSWRFFFGRNFPVLLRILRIFRSRVKAKKRLFPEGKVIAISGAEATGKSTMVELLAKNFGQEFNVIKKHTGKPPLCLTLVVNLSLKALKKMIGSRSLNGSATTGAGGGVQKLGKRQSMIKRVLSVMLSLEVGVSRLMLTKDLIRKAGKGSLVVTDRWPSSERGKMDGPRIDPGGGRLEDLSSKLEKWIYQKIPNANYCLLFSVPLALAIKRNQERIKEGKETQSQVISRHEKNLCFIPKADVTVCYRNVGEIDNSLDDIIYLVNSELSRDRKKNYSSASRTVR